MEVFNYFNNSISGTRTKRPPRPTVAVIMDERNSQQFTELSVVLYTHTSCSARPPTHPCAERRRCEYELSGTVSFVVARILFLLARILFLLARSLRFARSHSASFLPVFVSPSNSFVFLVRNSASFARMVVSKSFLI